MRNTLFLFFLCGTLLGFSQTRRQPEQTQKSKLIVYGIDDCHYCHDTKVLLDKKKIEYIFYDVDKNIEKQQEMITGLKAASRNLKNLNMPVIKKGERYLLNDGNLEKFHQQLLKLVATDAPKN